MQPLPYPTLVYPTLLQQTDSCRHSRSTQITPHLFYPSHPYLTPPFLPYPPLPYSNKQTVADSAAPKLPHTCFTLPTPTLPHHSYPSHPYPTPTNGQLQTQHLNYPTLVLPYPPLPYSNKRTVADTAVDTATPLSYPPTHPFPSLPSLLHTQRDRCSHGVHLTSDPAPVEWRARFSDEACSEEDGLFKPPLLAGESTTACNNTSHPVMHSATLLKDHPDERQI